MLALHKLQTQFAEAMLDPGGKGSELAIRANGLSAARRLQVYRNNVFASLTGALRACYPVIDRLLGERFFDSAAKHYIRDYPSTSGNLHDFGREYAGFIRAFPPAAELVYLSDVARLEWAYQEVFHAPEPKAFGLDGLSSVPPDRYGELRFKLHPASRLLVSEYPILHIWQVNQPGCDGMVDLSEGGVNLLVIRRGIAIQIEALSPAEYALLANLAQGHVMSYAAAHALKAEPELDLPACLGRHVARRTIAGFEL
ncbi:MAG: DNA-binding domain-containing protein [Methylocella sp.]